MIGTQESGGFGLGLSHTVPHGGVMESAAGWKLQQPSGCELTAPTGVRTELGYRSFQQEQ